MRATVPLAPGVRACLLPPFAPSTALPLRHHPPNQPHAREAHRAAAERSDRQYLAITKYEFTFNNCGKHRRTRRVATGGESDEIRSRPRARPLGVNSDLPSPSSFPPPPHPPPPLPPPFLLPSLTHRTVHIIIIIDDFVAPYWPPTDTNPSLSPRACVRNFVTTGA